MVLMHGCRIGSTHLECILRHILPNGPASGARRPKCPYCRKAIQPLELKLIKKLAEMAAAERADGSGNTIPDPACLQQPADAAEPAKPPPKKRRSSYSSKQGEGNEEEEKAPPPQHAWPSHNGPFPCPKCGEVFSRKANMQRHVEHWHPPGGIPPRKHKQKPSMENYVAGCAPCKRGFKTAAALKQHMQRPSVHYCYTAEGARDYVEWAAADDAAAAAAAAPEEEVAAPATAEAPE